MNLFEGQQDRVILSLEQQTALTSSDRAEVMWTFNPDVPDTVANVAMTIGKSPQTVHHHVKILVEKNLLISTGTQKKRSRQEKLYVWAFQSCGPQREGASPKYRQQSAEVFASVARKMIREYEKLQHATADHSKLAMLSSLYDNHYHFEPDSLPAVREVFREAMQKLKELSCQPGTGFRYHVVTFANPTVNSVDLMTKPDAESSQD